MDASRAVSRVVRSLLLPLLVGCASQSDAPPDARTVVGLSTLGFDDTGTVKHVSLRVTRGSEVKTSEVDLPTERTELAIQGSGPMLVELEGYAGATKEAGALRWVQRTRFDRTTNDTRLVRMNFDPWCVANAASEVLRCGENETCAMGRCIGMQRSSIELEPYAPDWFTPKPDACRRNAVQPAVEIGAGASALKVLEDGATVALEPGPQGGHHLWLGVRSTAFAERGTLILISARNPTTGKLTSPASFVFALTPAGDGRCEVRGLRYQVDMNGIDYRSFLGGPLDLAIEMRDRFGAHAQAVRHVQVAP